MRNLANNHWKIWDVGFFSSLYSNLQIIGSLFVLSGVAARPDAKPQKGIDHTYGFVRYTNGAIVPEDTPSVKAVKSDFLMAKAYADSGFETVEVIGENTPDVYANIEEVEAKPYAMPQYKRKGIDHTYNFVRYTNGAIVPDDTPSVKAVKSDFLIAKAYADSEFETSEVIGENTPDVYANIDEVEAKPYAEVPTSVVYAAKAPQTMPLKKVTKTLVDMKAVKADEKTPLVFAVNPYYQFYQPQVYGANFAPQAYRPLHHIAYQPHLYGMPAHRHFGKREAEAEPEAEAEAEAQFYNYYGNNYRNNYGNYYGNYPATYTTKAFGYSFNTKPSPYTSTYPYVVDGITYYNAKYPNTYNTKYPTTYNAKYPNTYNTAYNRYPYTYNPYSLVARAPTSAVYASSAPASGVYATSTPTSTFYATKAQPMPLRDYISYFNAQAQRRSNMVQTPAIQKRVTREAEAEPEADAQYYNNYFGTYATPYAGSGYPNLHTAYTGYPNAHTAYTGYPNAVNAYYTGSPYTKTAFKGYSYFSSPYTTYHNQYY